MLCYVILCDIMSYHVMLCHVMLCYAMLSYVNIIFRHVMLRIALLTTRLSGSSSQLLSTIFYQVYHLCRNSARYMHERANNTYSVTAAFCADLTTTAIGLLIYIPGTAVAYFMMGYPREAYPFVMCVYYMVSREVL